MQPLKKNTYIYINLATSKKKKKIKKIMHFLQNCIGPTIRIGRESWCLPYAGFFRQSSYCLHCRPPVSLEEGSWESGCVSG